MKTFRVLTTPLVDRLLAKLVQQHPELPEIFESAIAVLKTDPHNLSRSHSVKKLRGINPGNGQYRLRIGRWRFRYDIWDKRQEIELSYCGLQREDSYRFITERENREKIRMKLLDTRLPERDLLRISTATKTSTVGDFG